MLVKNFFKFLVAAINVIYKLLTKFGSTFLAICDKISPSKRPVLQNPPHGCYSIYSSVHFLYKSREEFFIVEKRRLHATKDFLLVFTSLIQMKVSHNF